MKKLFLLLSSALLIAACSSPKYSYNFDYYDYNSGKKHVAPSTAQVTPVVTSVEETPSPLVVDQRTLVADASPAPVIVEKTISKTDKEAIAKKISALSTAERKSLVKDLKTELKKYKKSKRAGDYGASVNATKVWDHDLKLAAIFGAIGLVLTLFAGINTAFWVLGVIAFVIGVVFLIKWLARQ